MIGFVAAMLAGVAAPVPLAPTGKWLVDYQTDMCLVSRPFGTTETSTLFAIKPAIVFGSGRASLYLLTPNGRDKGIRRGIGRVRLQPSGKSFAAEFVSAVPKGGDRRAYEFAANRDVMAAFGESTGLELEAGSDTFAFQTGNMRAIYTALDACNADLLKSWGVDPTAQAEIAGSANAASWFPADSYPAAAKRRGGQGRITIVLTVGESGGVTVCRVAVSTKDPDLDKTTCDLARQHGRFTVARGKADRFAVLAVDWQLDN